MDKKRYYQSPAVAQTYEQKRIMSPSGDLTQQAELSVLRSVMRLEQSWLELACGTGRLLRALRSEGRHVTGMDQSEAMLRAGGLVPDPHIIIGDVFRVPMTDASVDGIYCFRFTNHYEDLRPFFFEVYRLLKPGGQFIFDTMRWSLLGSRLWGQEANFPVSDKRVRAWLTQVGFQVKRVDSLFPIGPYVMAKLPLPLARLLLGLRRFLPNACQAIAVWHVERPR